MAFKSNAKANAKLSKTKEKEMIANQQNDNGTKLRAKGNEPTATATTILQTKKL